MSEGSFHNREVKSGMPQGSISLDMSTFQFIKDPKVGISVQGIRYVQVGG